MSDKNALLALLAEVLPPRPLNLDDKNSPSFTVTPAHAEQMHIRFNMLAEALAQVPASHPEGREGWREFVRDCAANAGDTHDTEKRCARARALLAASPTPPAVDDAMVKRAEQVRVETLHKVTAYGSAGVEERYLMAMRDALTTALAKQEQ